MKTQKNLYQQIIEEVKKRGGETGGEITIRGIISSLISPSATNTSVQAIYEYLGKALKEQIVSGLYTVADSPSSKYIWVKNKGEDSVGVKAGIIYSLSEDTKVEVPFPQPDAPVILFVNLTTDGRVLIETRERDNGLTIAKVNIPYPQSLDVVDDYEKGAMSAYIVTARDLCFRNDFAIDDDTINALRNNMNKLLADNLVGNIKLSEGLKILNQRGTFEMDSEEMRILYLSKVVGARFNKEGTYFYDESGIERARFTAEDARIGNIRITGHTLESVNYETEGFQIKDTGEIDLKESHGYKMMLMPGGIFIRGKMCVINHPPSGDDYLRNVAIKTIEATPVIISENKYNFGAKNGQFIKKPAYADNTSSFPDHIYIDYTTNEGVFSNEEHIFAMQDSVVAIITTDSQLDASYVRNLIVGKITNPVGNTYFDLLKGKLNIESNDLDEDNKFVIGNPIAGAGLRYDKSKKELLMSGLFSTTGSKEWDSKDDFDGEKHQVDIETNLGHILLDREPIEWEQTTDANFNAGTKNKIEVLGDAFKLSKIEEINQQQTICSQHYRTYYSALAQSFKVNKTLQCSKISVFLNKWWPPDPTITFYLKADNNNSPGTTLASKTCSYVWGWNDFIWDSPIQLNPNTRYWIYTPQYGSGHDNCYSWLVSTINPYANGNFWTSIDGHVMDKDASFKVWEQYYESSGDLISQDHHFGTDLHHWEPIVITKTLNGQTLTIKTQTAPDVGGSPGTWEEEKSLDVQDKPTSTIYIDTWFRWRAYLSTTDGTKTPVVYDITAKARKKYYSNGYDRLVWGFGNKVSYTTYSFVAEESPASPVTNAKVRFRCADTEAGLDTADWSAYFEATSGSMTDANIFDSIWIEAEVYLETNDTDYTPDFDKLIVNFTQGLNAQTLNEKLESELDVDKVNGKDIPNTIANLLTDHNKAGHDALGLDHGSLSGKSDDDHIQYHNNARHDSTTRHPVSVIKFTEGSFSEALAASATSSIFEVNYYTHQIQIKSSYVGQDVQLILAKVTGTTYASNYQIKNWDTQPRTVYGQWKYHSASKQAIWGIWDKDEKKLVCVLVEENEGYCKLYPALKENQKLIKIKSPEKYKGLFAWDIIDLSKEKKIKEEDLEEM